MMATKLVMDSNLVIAIVVAVAGMAVEDKVVDTEVDITVAPALHRATSGIER